MKYRVIHNFRAYPFETYAEALSFRNTHNGAVIYELAWHQKF